MPEELRIAVVLAAWCQLRRGEVRGLRRKDVDLVLGVVTIEVTRTTAMSGRTIVKEPKSVRVGAQSPFHECHFVLLAAHLEAHVAAVEEDRSSSPAPTARSAWHGLPLGLDSAEKISGSTTSAIRVSPGRRPPVPRSRS